MSAVPFQQRGVAVQVQRPALRPVHAVSDCWPNFGLRPVAVGIRGRVAALQPDLVHPQAPELRAAREELLVEAQPAARGRIGVDLGQPAAHAVRVELVVPRPVQRVGQVDPLAVPADLDHLRAAGQPLARRRGVRDAAGDAAEPDRADLAGVRRIAHVVLLELAGAPAGDVEELVIHGQVDVADQRRHRPERLERGRQRVRVGGLGRDGDHLVGTPAAVLAAPPPHRGGQVVGADHHADEAPGLLGVVRRAQLKDHLVLLAEVDRLQVLARRQVPEVQCVPVLAAQQQFGVDPVLDHRRGAPLAGDQRVLVQVPPGVVGQVLRSAVGLPGAQNVEGVVVEQGDAARAVRPLAAAEAGHEDPVRAAVQGVRAGVARLLCQLVRADRPDQRRLPGVRVGVVDVDVGGPYPGQQQVAALQPVGVMPGVRE